MVVQQKNLNVYTISLFSKILTEVFLSILVYWHQETHKQTQSNTINQTIFYTDIVCVTSVYLVLYYLCCLHQDYVAPKYSKTHIKAGISISLGGSILYWDVTSSISEITIIDNTP